MITQQRASGWILLLLLSPLVIPSGLPGLLERRGVLSTSLTSLSLYRGVLVPVKVWATLALTIALIGMLWRSATPESVENADARDAMS